MSQARILKQKPPSLDELLLVTISRWGRDHNGGTVDLNTVVMALGTTMAAMITECPDQSDQLRLAQLAMDQYDRSYIQMNAIKRARERDAATLSSRN